MQEALQINDFYFLVLDILQCVTTDEMQYKNSPCWKLGIAFKGKSFINVLLINLTLQNIEICITLSAYFTDMKTTLPGVGSLRLVLNREQ